MGAGLAKDMAVMGLKGGFSLHELKSAFRARAKLCHPDLGARSGRDFSRLRDSYQRLLDHVAERDALPRRKSATTTRKGSSGASGRERQARRGPTRERNGKPDGNGSSEALGLYREAMAKYESFQAVNRDRSMELKFLHSLTKKGIALVDLHRFLRLLDALAENAAEALGLFNRALALDGGQEWAAEASRLAESLERQHSRCLALKAEVSGGE